ncbi:hypothetical protein [Fischerella sp. PCC 9605]|uniref:hypothetical protein n=1 Tax=Fischerella sp. PCC 9605 TaxID=1173024 RepID=UPI00047AED88|nr:hypothetical protein [Fischerella sp. PCC 9605]
MADKKLESLVHQSDKAVHENMQWLMLYIFLSQFSTEIRNNIPKKKRQNKFFDFLLNCYLDLLEFFSNLSKQTSPVIKHVFLSISLIAVAGTIVCLSLQYSKNVTQEWTKHLKYSPQWEKNEGSGNNDINQISNIKKYLISYGASDVEIQRLEDILKSIKDRAKSHIRVAIDYSQWLFSSTFTASILALLAVGCLFDISRKGWKDANNYIINIFVVSSGCALFSGALVAVFQYERNIRDNSGLYLAYVELENKVLTQLVTELTPVTNTGTSQLSPSANAKLPSSNSNLEVNQISPTKNGISLKEIISATNLSLSKLNAISIAVDTGSVPFIQTLNNIWNQNQILDYNQEAGNSEQIPESQSGTSSSSTKPTILVTPRQKR